MTLEYASNELRNDIEVIKVAVRENILALKYADKTTLRSVSANDLIEIDVIKRCMKDTFKGTTPEAKEIALEEDTVSEITGFLSVMDIGLMGKTNKQHNNLTSHSHDRSRQ